MVCSLGNKKLPGEQGRVPGVRVLGWRDPPGARSLAAEHMGQFTEIGQLAAMVCSLENKDGCPACGS